MRDSKFKYSATNILSWLKLVGLIVALVVLITCTVAAYNIASPPKTTNNATQSGQSSAINDTNKQTGDIDKTVDATKDQPVSKSTLGASTQPTSQTATTTTAEPTQQTANTAPQQTVTNPTPATPTCNESMKSSYTSLYSSKVNAENASWNNQITAWNNYASANGMAFSGYVQGMINDNKPAHDARLAQLQTQYYLNLATINCNP